METYITDIKVSKQELYEQEKIKEDEDCKIVYEFYKQLLAERELMQEQLANAWMDEPMENWDLPTDIKIKTGIGTVKQDCTNLFEQSVNGTVETQYLDLTIPVPTNNMFN